MRTLSLSLVALIALAGCDALGSRSDAEVHYLVEGDAAVTYLTAGGLSQAEARGTWEVRFEVAPETPLSIEATSSNGAPVRAQIEVDGRVVRATQGLSVRLDARTDDGASGELEVHGAVEAVGADRVTVLGRVFVVDGATELLGRDNETVPFESFTVGTFVEVEGRAVGDGTFRAKKIKLDDDDGEGVAETEVEGRIDAIDAASVTVAGTRFAVDAATRWLDDDNNPVDRSAFTVGARVEAEGATRGGVLTAKKVKLDDD